MLRFKHTYHLSSVGCEVARIVGQHASGKVLAVFDSSVYLQCGADVFCIAVSAIGPGPLHLLLDDKDSLPPCTLQRGQAVILSSGSAHGASTLGIENAGASARLHLAASDVRFSGEVTAPGMLPSAESVGQCKQALSGISMSALPVNGFAWLLDDTHWSGLSVPRLPLSTPGINQLSHSLNRKSLVAIGRLYSWLKTHFALDIAVDSVSDLSGAEPGLHELLGAGPGLTPSGDDLLAGVMLTLHALGSASTADMLWQFVEPHCARQTNVISTAHLRLAAQGRCSDSMLQLLKCLFRPVLDDSAAQAVGRAHAVQHLAGRMGATSGWDALAGVSLVLRAYVESTDRNTPDVTD